MADIATSTAGAGGGERHESMTLRIRDTCLVSLCETPKVNFESSPTPLCFFVGTTVKQREGAEGSSLGSRS